MFVSRRQDGKIYGCWIVRQSPEQEELPDDHPDIADFRKPPAAPDLADLDAHPKAVRALALVLATWQGKTPQQLKDAFRAALSALS